MKDMAATVSVIPHSNGILLQTPSMSMKDQYDAAFGIPAVIVDREVQRPP